MYKLFLDDIRNPATTDFVIARSSSEAIQIVITRGFPQHIALDHDLGDDDTGMVFLKKLQSLLDAGIINIPNNFSYSIHSANPVGRDNMDSYMMCLIRVYG